MATDVERLVVSLEASITKYERAMQKALGQTNNTTRQIERRFQRMNATINTQMAALGRSLIAPLLGGAAVRGFQQLVDANTRIENSLRVAGLAGQELTAVYDRLFESAQRNAAPLESLVTLFGRASLVQKELGISTEELLGFTDKVALALRVSGQSAAQSSGALLQLSQALGSGVVRAEEFNSVLEGALPIAQATAAGLEEAGGSVAKLRQLIVDGKVSSEAFFRAFEAGSAILEDKVAGASFTTAQGLERVNNALIRAAGQIDEATGLSAGLASALDTLGWAVENVGRAFEEWQGPIQGFIGLMGQAIDLIRLMPAIDPMRITREGAAALEELAARNKPVEITVNGGGIEPVSLKDFAPPTAKKVGGTGRGTLSDAQRQAKAQQDLIDQLRFEQEQLGRTAVEQEVMNNLRRVGADLMSEEGRQIAAVTRANYELQQSIEFNKEAFDTWRDASLDAIGSVIEALEDGKIEAAELGDILLAAVAAIANIYLPGSGQIIQALGGLFKGKRAAGGPVSPGGAYLVGERGPELMVPRTSGTIIPNKALGGGGEVVVYVQSNEYFDARVQKISGNVATRVTGSALRSYDNNLIGRVGESDARYR